MSYDIEICVKVEGCDKYARIALPEYDNPTYNLRGVFEHSMDWDYSQCKKNERGEWESVYYPCSLVVEKVEQGIRELTTNKQAYKQYEPENGWGTIDGAISCLESVRRCIYETAEDIPIECLYMRW